MSYRDRLQSIADVILGLYYVKIDMHRGTFVLTTSYMRCYSAYTLWCRAIAKFRFGSDPCHLGVGAGRK